MLSFPCSGTLTLFSLLLASSAMNPTVYLIRHGEKPDSGNGLSPEGQERAKCLVDVFAANTSYDIGYIIAEHPDSGEYFS